MFDYDKIHFKEVDDTDVPLQIFFEDEMSEIEFQSFVEDYIDKEQMQGKNKIVFHEFCLSMFSEHDYKLEMHVKFDDYTPDWFPVREVLNGKELLEALEREAPELEDVISEYLDSMKEQAAEEKKPGLNIQIAGAKGIVEDRKGGKEERQTNKDLCL